MINEIIQVARELNASDLHLTLNEPPCLRIDGQIGRLNQYPVLTAEVIEDYAQFLITASNLLYRADINEYDFTYVTPDNNRQRVNIFRQKGARGIVLRILNSQIPSLESLHLPAIFQEIASLPRGLVLVTGPTGSGKTTTLAAMVDFINHNRHDHILTIEDPIEYLHTGKNCIINQREIGIDTDDFAIALRSALREDPDIILVGEMRDLETMSAAITASETGHFVMGTLHTIGAAKTIDRLIDVFPPHQQQQVRNQLATVLKAVITQTLLPKKDGTGRVPAFEILIVNDAISNLIRENKTFQISNIMLSNQQSGMVILDMYLAALVKKDIITRDLAFEFCTNQEELKRYL